MKIVVSYGYDTDTGKFFAPENAWPWDGKLTSTDAANGKTWDIEDNGTNTGTARRRYADRVDQFPALAVWGAAELVTAQEGIAGARLHSLARVITHGSPALHAPTARVRPRARKERQRHA
jgi:hypothetical protein